MCITQPRRVAAVTLAVRVADEVGCMIGSTIGYAVRFDSKQDEEKTRVKFVTDGVLLQEMTSDPLLRKYSVIMIDEAHERSMQTDMCLGLLKKIQKVRSDLRIIVASATLDAQFFKDFFEQNVTSDSTKESVKIRLFCPELSHLLKVRDEIATHSYAADHRFEPILGYRICYSFGRSNISS